MSQNFLDSFFFFLNSILKKPHALLCAAHICASTDSGRKATPFSFFCSLCKNSLPCQHKSCFISKEHTLSEQTLQDETGKFSFGHDFWSSTKPQQNCFARTELLMLGFASRDWKKDCWEVPDAGQVKMSTCLWKSRCVVATGELFSFTDVLMEGQGSNLLFYRQHRCCLKSFLFRLPKKLMWLKFGHNILWG